MELFYGVVEANAVAFIYSCTFINGQEASYRGSHFNISLGIEVDCHRLFQKEHCSTTSSVVWGW